jgi:hypothetical protein
MTLFLPLQEVTLNHKTFGDVTTKGRYYGVTTGRVANRIRDGRFTVEGKVRSLDLFTRSPPRFSRASVLCRRINLR